MARIALLEIVRVVARLDFGYTTALVPSGAACFERPCSELTHSGNCAYAAYGNMYCPSLDLLFPTPFFSAQLVLSFARSEVKSR
jgi:hypothetical protein